MTGLALGTTAITLGYLPLGDFRSLALTASALAWVELFAVVAYRLFIAAFPLRAGEIAEGDAQQFVYHVHVLFFLIFFYPILRSGFWPAPFMRLFYQALGAQLGVNTYSQGIIHDPIFVRIGANSTVGQSALLIPHVIEGNRLAHYPIVIGDDVTVGALSVVLAGVTIGDGAVVATGAVVRKNTQIGAREIWGGVPARLIGRRQD